MVRRDDRETGPEPEGVALDAYCPPALRAEVARLAPLLYKDLLRLARRERRQLFAPGTLTTTALVHEAYLRLAGSPGFESRPHSLRVAAVTMRHLLVDRARAQLAAKRGGGLERVPLDEATELQVDDEQAVFEVHNALGRLAAFAPRLAEVVQCRYFAGYVDKEIAQALDVSVRTVRRDWVTARAWLGRELRADLPLEPER